MLSNFKEIFKKNEADIILVLGIILISLISFGFGWALAKNQSFNNYLAKNSNENEVKIEEDLSFKNSESNKKNNSENLLKAEINNQPTEKTTTNNSEKNNQTPSKENYKNNTPENNSSNANCKYVGSKNSNVYHLPECPGAKRIKDENKRCFSSKKEAEEAGYRPAKNCPGL